MKHYFTLPILALALALATGCSSVEQSKPTLKDQYAEYFPIGIALGAHTYQSPKADSLITTQFSSVTAENCMKPLHVGISEGKYNFEQADQMIAYAQANGMVVRGHTLLWHQSAPKWFFADDAQGNAASKELIYSRLRQYIHDVVGHFKGRVYCWDVVNEAVSDDGETFMREESPWFKHCGDEFMEKAFIYAREADPNVQLFYNDYSVVYKDKRDRVIKLIKGLQSKGVPIDGIGIQGHWNIASPTREELVATIEDFKALGLRIHITELDVRMSSHWAGGELTAEDYDHAVYELSPELDERQTDQYNMIFETLREYRDDIESVTFWNLYDKDTWLDRRHGNIGRNYPLLFDDDMKTKSAYDAVVNF